MARRPLLAAAAIIALGGAGLWGWWTALPRASSAELAATAAHAPADAAGVVVIAQPARFARWLARHRASLWLALLLPPGAHPAAEALRPLAASLLRAAQSPLLAWWGQNTAGLSVEVKPGEVAPLRHVAALTGVGWRAQPLASGRVRVWVSFPAAVVIPALPPPTFPTGSSAALAYLDGHWWEVHLTRTGLTVRTGTPPELPHCDQDTVIVTPDLSTLLPAASLPALPVAALISPAGEWGLRVGRDGMAEQLARWLRRLGGRPHAGGENAAVLWSTPLGRFYAAPGEPASLASCPELVAGLPDPKGGESWGCIHGSVLAHALSRAVPFLARLPGVAREDQLQSLAQALGEVRHCSWRYGPAGGHLAVKW